MPVISESKDYVVFVGGLGLGSGCADPGGCTKEFWGEIEHPDKDLTDVMNSNGGNLSASGAAALPISCTVTNNGSGKLRITYAAGFENCVPGLVAKVTFAATYTNGRYEIIDYDSSSFNWVDIDEPYSADTTCACAVGGAHVGIQTAMDETDASGTSPHNVYILDNVDYTFTAPANEIDLDSGGDLSAGTWKRVIATNNHGVPHTKYNHVNIDANSQTGASCFVFGDADNISLEGFNCTGSDNAQIKFSATTSHYNFRLVECKTGSTTYGVQCTTGNNHNILILGGAYINSSGYPIYLDDNNARFVNVYSNGAHASYPNIRMGAGQVVVSGCIFKGNNQTGIQVSGAGALLVEDSTFYLSQSCIQLSHASARLMEYGNIFYVSTIANGRAILRTLGTILYSNYSILWTTEGAPTNSTRWGRPDSYVPYNALEDAPLLISPGVYNDYRLSGPSPAIRTSMPTLGKLSY